MRRFLRREKPHLGPGLAEVLSILVATVALSDLLAVLVRPHVQGTPYGVLTSWASHGPQLLIPWVWYRLRVVPTVNRQGRATAPPAAAKWRRSRPFWVLLLVLGGSKFMGEAATSWGEPRPLWASAGILPIVLVLLFQGVMVGFSEEMMFRPALHLPLRFLVPGQVRAGGLALSRAMLLTALIFGLFHGSNVLLGASLPAVVAQSVAATLVGMILGSYYDRTGDYAGVAMLHNALDGGSYLALLVVTR